MKYMRLAAALPLMALAAGTSVPAQTPPRVTAADLQPLEELRKTAVATLGITNAPRFDLDLIAQNVNALHLHPYLENGWAKGRRMPSFEDIKLSPEDMAEIVDLGIKAANIFLRVSAREQAHRRLLAARGIAEVPASTAACRFRLDAGKNSYLFDKWGELQIDRRFLDKADMDVIRRIEACYRRIFGGSAYAASMPAGERTIISRAEAGKKMPLPVFRGFEDDRYQAHDALILKLTADFNAHKADWIGGSAAQAAKTASLTPAMVKAHMIEESGGNGPASRAAWLRDPLQVNVPGDWDAAKTDLGLKKPVNRNEGTLDANVRAAIMFLARKGFGKSGKAARLRPTGFFDGWPDALRRYNARRDRTADGRYYSDAYADRILARAKNPDAFVPIEIKLAK
ncbi:MAG: hypothetical protein IJ658_06375 [Kiritimatiellae bacterium]|nr:hypothetical protein [Kiritimatiellia bacterium]